MEERTTCRSRSSTTSASTTRTPTRSTAACRTTAPGSATPPIPAASPTAAGRTSTGGDGFWAFADPTDPDLCLRRVAGRLDQPHQPPDAGVARYPAQGRLQGEAALQLEHADRASARTSKGTIYIGAQFLFRTRDHGQTWDRISPDLTTNDPAEAEAGGERRHHRRQLGGRDAHDDLFDQRVAATRRDDLGRHRRRQRPAHARRRRRAGPT